MKWLFVSITVSIKSRFVLKSFIEYMCVVENRIDKENFVENDYFSSHYTFAIETHQD